MNKIESSLVLHYFVQRLGKLREKSFFGMALNSLITFVLKALKRM